MPIDSKNYHDNQRIEAAYTFDGPTAYINTVEKLLNIPFDHYCVFNFLSFIKFIGAIGGIDIDVQHSFDGVTKDGPDAIHFDEEKQHVDGTKTLSYARERHSDIMRGFRQQEIIQSIGNKLKFKEAVKNLKGIIDSFNNNIQTDITTDQLLDLMKNGLVYSDYEKQRLTFDWRTFSNQGRSMVELYPDSIDYVSHELRVSLGIDKKKNNTKKALSSIPTANISIKATTLFKMKRPKTRNPPPSTAIPTSAHQIIQKPVRCPLLKLKMVLSLDNDENSV